MDDTAETFRESMRNESTRSSYTGWLYQFLDYIEMSGDEALELNHEEAWKKMHSFTNHLLDNGLASNSVTQAWQGCKKFFYYNNIYIIKKPEIPNLGKTFFDHIPVKPDLIQLENASDVHYNLGECLIAFSGPRPVDAQSLTYESIKASYEAEDKVVTAKIRQQKTGRWYVTFIPPQTITYLDQNLKYFEREWGSLKSRDTLLYNRFKGTPLKKRSLSKGIGLIINKTVGKHPTGEENVVFRPYGLRKFFRRQMSVLGDTVAEYLMGRKSAGNQMSITYNGLADLDPVAIEQIKERYTKALPHLETHISPMYVNERIQQVENEQREIILMQQAKIESLGQRMNDIEELNRIREEREKREKLTSSLDSP